MDPRYYRMLRQATQEEYYKAVNDPEDELYDVIWDLLETVLIEPAEIFDGEFRERNQFRYSIESGMILEFVPGEEYFTKRNKARPSGAGTEDAGIHLRLSVMPGMSCLFSAGLQVWGPDERLALKRLWRTHRRVLSELLQRAKPMVSTLLASPTIEHTESLEEMLDVYFSARDPHHFLLMQYSFAQSDESDAAQNFMVLMALLYQSIKDYCFSKEDRFLEWLEIAKDFYSGQLPEIPAPLPCVELPPVADAG